MILCRVGSGGLRLPGLGAALPSLLMPCDAAGGRCGCVNVPLQELASLALACVMFSARMTLLKRLTAMGAACQQLPKPRCLRSGCQWDNDGAESLPSPCRVADEIRARTAEQTSF